MKFLPILSLVVLLINTPIIYAQELQQQELDNIRNVTYQKLDSLLKVKEAISAKLDTTIDTAIKENLQSNLSHLDKAIESTGEKGLQYSLSAF